MTEKHLFGAEVDQIQNTLFRAARQRQVVGGSQLLAVFGEQAVKLARNYGADGKGILITAGGRFSVIFPNKEQALGFGEDLANAYHELLNASITIAEPVQITEGFRAANDQIDEKIRRLKHAVRGRLDVDHAPTIAYCQSSGVGLAAFYAEPVLGEDTQYLSGFAKRMALAGYQQRSTPRGEIAFDPFLDRIRDAIPGEEHELGEWRWAGDVDEIAALDGDRKNVAYLVADANDMGRLFSKCARPEQLKQLSQDLDNATRTAVATPIPVLIRRLEEAEYFRQGGFLPLLPLILAGDDVFILLPAKYAADYTRRFCLVFEEIMARSQVVQELRKEDESIPPPTMAGSIIFCKGNYPYHLAHERGELLLGQAKRLIKTVGHESGGTDWHSAVNFDFIVGGDQVSKMGADNAFLPSFAPYWAGDDGIGETARQRSRSLSTLLVHRWLLHILPRKRLAELRDLFSPQTLPVTHDALREEWNPRLDYLRQRIKVSSPNTRPLQALDQAMMELGNQSDKSLAENPGHWKGVSRAGGEMTWRHGLPDLLAIWDYAQSLDWSLAEYGEESE